MKLNKYTLIALAGLAFGACSDMDEMAPQSGTLLDSQLAQANDADPTRVDAAFNGMYTKLGMPWGALPSNERPDDFGFIMMSYSNDLEGADMVTPNSGYNWFSVCGELSSRNANYANPFIRYASAYNQVTAANDVIKAYSKMDQSNPENVYKMAQAYAMRAFSYLNLAPYFQFSYQIASDKPCVPIVTETTEDFTQNPRASVKEVYDLILSDLTFAIEKLEGYARPDKAKIDQQVAYGLRARAYLNMGKWAEALADAERAAAGYTPATVAEVSKPSFYDINEHNWLWGYDMTGVIALKDLYANASSWVRSFSAEGYAAACQVYAQCNVILYDKIPATDVRKGWWVDENLDSPLLAAVTWNGVSGNDVADLAIENIKEPFLPYTNVKFGMNTYGSTTNDEDWPFMRVEEMLLIQAECHLRNGDEAKAKEVLEGFVKTYRDPAYSCDPAVTKRTLENEIWFQRRIELWGEGFSNSDTRRLNKPLVRFHDENSNFPEAFRFNLKNDDGWWLLRFPQDEMDTNLAIVDNTDGTSPVQDQNADLRDGVTD